MEYFTLKCIAQKEKNMIRKLILSLSIFMLAGTLGLTKAQASLEIWAKEDGGAASLLASAADFTSASFSGNFGDFALTITAGSSHNTAGLSDLLSSTNDIRYTTSATGTHSITILVTQSNYTLPVGAPVLKMESGMGGSFQGSYNASNVFQAFFDKNNNLLGMADQTNGPQFGVPTASTFDTGSASSIVNRLGTPFSLTSQQTFTLAPGTTIGFQSHINVTPTPVPAGVVLAGMGIAVVGGMNFLRRRKVVTA